MEWWTGFQVMRSAAGWIQSGVPEQWRTAASDKRVRPIKSKVDLLP